TVVPLTLLSPKSTLAVFSFFSEDDFDDAFFELLDADDFDSLAEDVVADDFDDAFFEEESLLATCDVDTETVDWFFDSCLPEPANHETTSQIMAIIATMTTPIMIFGIMLRVLSATVSSF